MAEKTDSRNPSENRGYTPMKKGYQPTSTDHEKNSGYKPQEDNSPPPPPPKGGSGESKSASD